MLGRRVFMPRRAPAGVRKPLSGVAGTSRPVAARRSASRRRGSPERVPEESRGAYCSMDRLVEVELGWQVEVGIEGPVLWFPFGRSSGRRDGRRFGGLAEVLEDALDRIGVGHEGDDLKLLATFRDVRCILRHLVEKQVELGPG